MRLMNKLAVVTGGASGMGEAICPDCSPWINPGGSTGCWDVTDRTGDISKKVEMSFFYFRSIPKSPQQNR